MLERRGFPGGSAFGEFVGGDVHVDGSLVSVDGDLVAGLDEGE